MCATELLAFVPARVAAAEYLHDGVVLELLKGLKTYSCDNRGNSEQYNRDQREPSAQPARPLRLLHAPTAFACGTDGLCQR
jgi:hypothetical protein